MSHVHIKKKDLIHPYLIKIEVLCLRNFLWFIEQNELKRTVQVALSHCKLKKKKKAQFKSRISKLFKDKNVSI